MKKTVLELFAGVGGFRVGLEQSGNWDVIWANQWEPNRKNQYAFDCYRSHFKTGIHINEDIASIKTSDIPTHSLLVGGFPCQDYSVARTQAKGIHGKKGVLWWEIKRIIDEKRPPFVLLENVDRLLKSPAKQRGRDFAVILGCFKELGYSVEWRVINAADYGHPQRRRRVFIFASYNSTNYYENLAKCNSLEDWLFKNGFFQGVFPIIGQNTHFPKNPPIILEQDIVAISENFTFNFENSGVMIKGKIYTSNTSPLKEKETPLSTVLEANANDSFFIKESELDKWEYLKGSKREPRKTSEGFEYLYSEGAIAFPDHLDKPGRTMLTSEGSLNRSTHVVCDLATKNLRILTPIECERLNGFEDNWTDTGMPQKFRYFCMGNALVVGLVKKMGCKLNEIFDNENRLQYIDLNRVAAVN